MACFNWAKNARAVKNRIAIVDRGVCAFTVKAKNVQDAALLFATYVVRPDLAAGHMAAIGGPSAVKGVVPGADSPIQAQYANWLGDGLQLYLPGDQSLPQEMVAAYFEAQDSVVLGAMTPAQAAKSVQEAIVAFKARQR